MGCLTRLVLISLLAGAVLLAIIAVFAPWGFYMGGRFHWFPSWSGWGRLHSNSAGGDYAIYISISPRTGRRYGRTHVGGTGILCTPRGERFNLIVGGDFEKNLGLDTNGKTASFYIYNRTPLSRIVGNDPRPSLELRGKWSNPDLVLDDHGSLARAFDHNATLYPSSKKRPYAMGEISPVTLHEGVKSDFEAACAAVKKSHTDRKPATEEDAKAGRAIFYIPDNRSVVYEFGRPLPIAARTKQDIELGGVSKQRIPASKHKREILPAGTLVQIVQCEIGDTGDILVGFRYAGGEGICLFDELEIIK